MKGEQDLSDARTQVYRISRCNISAMRKAARRLSLLYDSHLAPVELKSSQYGILSELNSRGAALPTVNELAEALVMDRSTLGQNLRPLERHGLVKLVTDPQDRRSRLIALTKLGVTKYKEARRYWEIAQDRFEAVFGKAAAATLRAALFRIAYDAKLTKPGNAQAR
jgi:DNA-binding MarR family transcriptional regulator